jgi:glycosyltransferase involved in cell wall biosynthesis
VSRAEAATRRPVIFVAGRDPEVERDGGHSSYVRAHAFAAMRAGYEPHLFCVGPDTRETATAYGLIHQVRSLRPFRQNAIAVHSPPLSRAIVSFLRGCPRATIVHAFGVWGFAARSACRAAAGRDRHAFVIGSYTTYADENASKRRGARIGYGPTTRAATILATFWAGTVVDAFERRAYRDARLVLCNYATVERMIATRHGSGVRLRRIGYGSEAAFLHPAATVEERGGGPAKPPTLVSISRHDPRKGVDVLIHALARLRSRGIVFRATLLGGGPLLESDRRLARRLGLTDDVVEIPGYTEDAMGPLSRADVFCLPSREEQSGSLAVLEALQAGAAIVASDCDGIPEDLTHELDALLVEPGDPAALAGALERVLGDSGLWRRLKTGAGETHRRRFSAEAFTGEIAALYAELESES